MCSNYIYITFLANVNNSNNNKIHHLKPSLILQTDLTSFASKVQSTPISMSCDVEMTAICLKHSYSVLI